MPLSLLRRLRAALEPAPLSRRDVLRAGGAAVGGTFLHAQLTAAPDARERRVLVIGAGLAGLACADEVTAAAPCPAGPRGPRRPPPTPPGSTPRPPGWTGNRSARGSTGSRCRGSARPAWRCSSPPSTASCRAGRACSGCPPS